MSRPAEELVGIVRTELLRVFGTNEFTFGNRIFAFDRGNIAEQGDYITFFPTIGKVPAVNANTVTMQIDVIFTFTELTQYFDIADALQNINSGGILEFMTIQPPLRSERETDSDWMMTVSLEVVYT